MKELGLRERLLKFMLANHTNTFIASGDLQRIVMANSKHTARSAVRRLQELAEEGKLVCELRKGHAYYKAATTPIPSPHNKQTCQGCKENTLAVANW